MRLTKDAGWPSYVLVTPARNEEVSIAKTIRSVLAQTILPMRWVIVSDGSTDNTDAIVREWTKGKRWIEFLRLEELETRHFAAKVRAFSAGYEKVKELDFEIIGNVDADISFTEDFFEFLLDKFRRMPELGVAGTDYREGEFHSYRDSFISASHVNGQCQLFRRSCFEEIGGYQPIREGGIDWAAVTSARMLGWKTCSFADRTYIHHHLMGRTYGNVLRARFCYGRKDYLCGGHPLWQLLRSIYQMSRKPYFIGGLLLLAGYFSAWLRGARVAVPQNLMVYYRHEQMQRLRHLAFLRGRNRRR